MDRLVEIGVLIRFVEFVESTFCVRQVAVVKGVGVHLHEEGKCVQGKEDLSCPRPLEEKWPLDPEE